MSEYTKGAKNVHGTEVWVFDVPNEERQIRIGSTRTIDLDLENAMKVRDALNTFIMAKTPRTMEFYSWDDLDDRNCRCSCFQSGGWIYAEETGKRTWDEHYGFVKCMGCESLFPFPPKATWSGQSPWPSTANVEPVK